jgi:hypothetical protein
MNNKMKLAAVINQINCYLNDYLNNYQFVMVSKNKIKEGYWLYKVNYQYYDYIKMNDDGANYLAFKDPLDFRNSTLSLERIKNIYLLREKLITLLKGLNTSNQNSNNVLNDIESSLNESLRQNTALSSQFSKSHRSFRESRLIGLSIFFSWWNKTWFQSRATVALEKALAVLKEFKQSTSKELSPTSPPSYETLKKL